MIVRSVTSQTHFHRTETRTILALNLYYLHTLLLVRVNLYATEFLLILYSDYLETKSLKNIFKIRSIRCPGNMRYLVQIIT